MNDQTSEINTKPSKDVGELLQELVKGSKNLEALLQEIVSEGKVLISAGYNIKNEIEVLEQLVSKNKEHMVHPSTCGCEKYLCLEKFKNYQRLKRIEDNIKEKIDILKCGIKYGSSSSEKEIYNNLLGLLESLDK